MSDLIERLEALEQLLPSAVLDLIQNDPHQWSTRPCPTCRTITSLLGKSFGCDLHRKRTQRRMGDDL